MVGWKLELSDVLSPVCTTSSLALEGGTGLFSSVIFFSKIQSPRRYEGVAPRARRGEPTALDAHRPHDVLEVGVVRNGEQRRAVAIRQFQSHHLLAHIRQRIDQVGDVEADLDVRPCVVDVELVHGFFLLGVVGRNAQSAGFDIQAYALELFTGQDGGALQRGQQRYAAQGDVIRVVLRDDAVVIRELAFHQFGDELHVAKTELRLIVGKAHFDRAFGVAEQALQLQHGLARQDHFLLRYFHVQRGRSERQPVTIRGHQTQLRAFSHKQNAVEVVANVMHGHRERNLTEQVFQGLLWHAEGGSEGGRFLYQRKIFSRHALQCEFTFAAFEDQLRLCRLQTHSLIGRHGAQYVDKFARANGCGEVASVTVQGRCRTNLNLQVAGGELQRAAAFANQHVGQDRQRVAPLHHTGDGLQRCENLLLCCLQNDHVNLCNLISLTAAARADVAHTGL